VERRKANRFIFKAASDKCLSQVDHGYLLYCGLVKMQGNIGLFDFKTGVKTPSLNCYAANLNIIFLDAGCTRSILTS